MRKNIALALIGCCLGLTLYFPVSSVAQQPGSVTGKTDREDHVDLNFQNAEIRSVVEAIGSITGKTFIIDPRAKGAINIISTRPVPIGDVYEIFLSALRLVGFTTIEEDGITKIVIEGSGKQDLGRVFEGKVTATGDRIVTLVFPLKYESANEIIAVLRPLISPNNAISSLQSANTLIITDYANNLRRITRIIETLDRPKLGDVEIIKLEYLSVLDFSDIVKEVFSRELGKSVPRGGPAGPGMAAIQGGRIVIVPDIRSNSLLVRSENMELVNRIKNLAMKLDVEESGAINIHVVPLQHNDPTNLAKILNQLLSTQAVRAATTPQRTPGAPQSQAIKMSVQAEESTKSLIISAPGNVYNILRDVIDRLDIRRDQIYVEAIIVEMTSDRVAEFGVQWQSIGGFDSNRAPSPAAVGGVNVGDSGALGQITNTGPTGVMNQVGLNVGIINGTITLPNGSVIPNLLTLAHFLETEANANILSTPNLLTLDNEEASITVGQNVPFITGSYTPSTSGTTTGVNPFQTIERKDVGLTLKIKPRISESDSVQLKIYQETSSVAPGTTGAADVVTNKRSLDSTVLVDDNQIIVIGGLMQNQLTTKEEKVPLLGDIPILGHLFRFDKRKREKTNLVLFLRPHIVRSQKDLVPITSDRYDFMFDEQSEMKPWPNIFLPKMDSPQLPEFELNKPFEQKQGNEDPADDTKEDD